MEIVTVKVNYVFSASMPNIVLSLAESMQESTQIYKLHNLYIEQYIGSINPSYVWLLKMIGSLLMSLTRIIW